MALSRETAQVKIGNGSAWIGSDVYPLRQIARVSMRKLEPNTGGAWKSFVIRTIVIVGLGLLLSLASKPFGTVMILAGMAIVIWRLVARLMVRPVYGLVLSNAGTDTHAIWSLDSEEIDRLVITLTRAIAQPDMPVMTTIINAVVDNREVNNVYGDSIKVNGIIANSQVGRR